MTKKLLAVSLTLVMAAGVMSGCGSSKSNESAQEKTTEAQTETVASTVDYSQGLNEDGTVKGGMEGDYVELCDYKNIKVPEADVKVEDSEVQSEIDTLMANYQTTNEIKDRAVADGDVVNIDFVGTVDGEEFEGGSAEGYDLTIGSGSFVDDFEEQLVGHKPGESLDVEVTFTDDYTENLAGKDAVFATTINYISETVTPELTDDFVKENLEETYGYTSVDDMKSKIADTLRANKKASYAWTYVVDNSTFKEIPEELVNPQLDVMLDGLKESVTMQGVSMEEYLTSLGYEDEAAFREAYYGDCEDMVKAYLVADAIAEENNLESTDEEVSNYFKTYMNTDDYDSFVDYYSRAYINRVILTNLAMDTVTEAAQVEE